MRASGTDLRRRDTTLPTGAGREALPDFPAMSIAKPLRKMEAESPPAA
jgi:hypothetical protein